LFATFQNSRKAQPYFDWDSSKVLPQIATNSVLKKIIISKINSLTEDGGCPNKEN